MFSPAPAHQYCYIWQPCSSGTGTMEKHVMSWRSSPKKLKHQTKRQTGWFCKSKLGERRWHFCWRGLGSCCCSQTWHIMTHFDSAWDRNSLSIHQIKYSGKCMWSRSRQELNKCCPESASPCPWGENLVSLISQPRLWHGKDFRWPKVTGFSLHYGFISQGS